MQTVLSGYQSKKVSGKKKGKDTRANRVMFIFMSKCRKNVFRKLSSIQACEAGFRELEAYGYEFGAFGFAGTHIHFAANVPEKYSVTTAKTMLKTWSAKRVFRDKPNFRKRYPRGSFWSGYEHHQGFGADRAKAEAYIQSQAEHHKYSSYRRRDIGIKMHDTARLEAAQAAESPQSKFTGVIGAEPLLSYAQKGA